MPHKSKKASYPASPGHPKKTHTMPGGKKMADKDMPMASTPPRKMKKR